MLLGRFVPMVLVLALAGSLARQQPVPVTAGTLPTHRPLFVAMLVGVVVIVDRADLLPGPHSRTAGRRTLIMTVSLQHRPEAARGRTGCAPQLRGIPAEDAADLTAGRDRQARSRG